MTLTVDKPYQPVPEIQEVLDAVNRLGNDLDHLSAQNISLSRSIRERQAQRFLWHIPVQVVRNFSIAESEHSVPVRLYVPWDKQLEKGGRLPLLVFFHGGGWMLGSIAVYDPVARELCRKIPALALSVEYRLAPENPFPAAIEDAEMVLRWVGLHAEDIGADPDRIIVSGDSSGGNLAIVSALRAIESGRRSVALHVLYYPSTDIGSFEYESYRQYGMDHILTEAAVRKFREFYLPNSADWTCPHASPLRAGNLRSMPRTIIIGAGCDPLRDEGKCYAQRLKDAGVPVIYRLEPQLIHAFLNFYNLVPSCSPYAEGVLAFSAGLIREAMGVQPH
jgi:acetyl esterase